MDFGASEVAARNKSIQAALLKEPFFALRFGELFHEGWHLKPKILNKQGPSVEIEASDVMPSIRQKGVDMRIGLDIASLTLKRQAQVIVLVTADSDFIPAMKFARLTDGKHASVERDVGEAEVLSLEVHLALLGILYRSAELSCALVDLDCGQPHLNGYRLSD